MTAEVTAPSTIKSEADDAAKKILPLGDRLLVRVMRDQRKVGSIWLPDGGRSLDVVIGQVVARGTQVKSKPWDVAVGDYVLFVRVCGVAYDGVLGLLGKMSQTGGKDAEYKFLKESELMAVVSPDAVTSVHGGAGYDGGATGMRSTTDL